MKSKNQILVSVIKNLASALTKSELHTLHDSDVVDVTCCLWKLSAALELKYSAARDFAIRDLQNWSISLNNHLFEGCK